MEINDFEIVWLYIIDSGKWLKKRYELKEIAEKLMREAKSMRGILRYYTPEELERLPKSEKKIRAILQAKDEKIWDLLELYYKLDMDNVDPEYLENLRFFRGQLINFKLQLPNGEWEPINIHLMYHHSGVMTLELSLKLKNMALTPEIINELQLLPRSETEVSVSLSRELLTDYAMINPKLREILQKNPKKKTFKRSMTFHEIIWTYWATLIRISNNKHEINSKEVLDLLRYKVFNFIPVLIFRFPEFETPDEILAKYKPEIYVMLTQEIYLEPNQIRPRLIDEVLSEEQNLSERIDHSIFIQPESCMILYTKKSRGILEKLTKKRTMKLEDLEELEKMEIILIEELLQIQKFNMEMYDYLLSKKSISEMETDELAQMRGRLSRAIEEFYNIKLLVKTSSITRFNRARLETYELDRSLEVLETKLELVDTAVTSIHNNLMEFLSILIGVLVTIGPIIALSIGEQYPVQASLLTLVVLIGIYFIYKQIYKIWYKRSKI
ncbi:MAG: hypothetical protein ACTSRS_18725 [Candidatus Helarchaeota archaeon]